MLVDGGWTLIESDDTGGEYGPKKYVEFEDSGDFDISADDSSFTRIFQLDDSGRLNFVDYLYGFATYLNGDNGPIVRILPEPHNEAANFFCVQPRGKRLVPMGSSGGIGQWKTTRVVATYRPLNYAVLTDSEIGTMNYTNPIDGQEYSAPNELNRFVERKYHYVINQVPTQGLMNFVSRWGPNPDYPSKSTQQNIPINSTLDNPPGQMFMFLEKELIWHNVPARSSNLWEPPNRKTVEALAGCINLTAFDGHNPGTVVLAGVQYEQKKPTLDTGLYMWDITYRLMCMDHGLKTVKDYLGNQYTGYVGPDWIWDTLNRSWDLVSAYGTALDDDSFTYSPGDLNALFAIQANS